MIEEYINQLDENKNINEIISLYYKLYPKYDKIIDIIENKRTNEHNIKNKPFHLLFPNWKFNEKSSCYKNNMFLYKYKVTNIDNNKILYINISKYYNNDIEIIYDNITIYKKDNIYSLSFEAMIYMKQFDIKLDDCNIIHQIHYIIQYLYYN